MSTPLMNRADFSDSSTDQYTVPERWQVDSHGGDGWARLGYVFCARDTFTRDYLGVYATVEEAQRRCDELNTKHHDICSSRYRPPGYRCMHPY